MKKTIIFKNTLHLFILLCFLIQMSACGTLMHPERRGQNSGRVDVGIAVLDGIGLLFFIIPGVIAYAVDFSTGAIYLPSGRSSSISADGEIKVMHVNPNELNEETIKTIVIRETGISGTLDFNKAEVWSLNGAEDVSGKLTEMNESCYGTKFSIGKYRPDSKGHKDVF